MRIYDVYLGQVGQELQTSLYIHDDGQKAWHDSPEWKSFYCTEDDKTAIEEMIDSHPNLETFARNLCIVHLRREPAQ